MASLKSLMAARKQQARITAPFARYSGPRQDHLACALCALPVKHESLWSAHVQSKTHRVNVQRHEAEQQQLGKRKRTHDSPPTPKRARAADGNEDNDREAEGDEAPAAGGSALPAGFFADSAQAPAPRAPSPAAAPAPAQEEHDPDLDAFLASLAGANPSAGPSTARATIAAAPVRFEFGAPVVAAEGEEDEEHAGGEEGEGEAEETEEEKAEREAREEREEMMARLEEEEREQREADEKVTVLKRRLEALRAARQSKKK